MQAELTYIHRGRLCVLNLAEGTRVQVAAGQIWLTEAGAAEDFVLAAGDEYEVRLGGKVLVDAADEASLHLCPPPDQLDRPSPALSGMPAEPRCAASTGTPTYRTAPGKASHGAS